MILLVNLSKKEEGMGIDLRKGESLNNCCISR